MEKNICLKCGHQWFQRSDKLSKSCPNSKCQAKNWYSTISKRDKYNFNLINIGDEKLYPWPENPNHQQALRERFNISNSLYSYSRRTKKEFRSVGTPSGLLVKRIK